MTAPQIENGMARVETAGAYLAARDQPCAHAGAVRVAGLRGLIVPDRAALCQVETTGAAYFARAEAPFLTLLAALPDEPLCVVATKLLVAPAASRVKGRALKLVPMSFARALAVTELRGGWAVLATKSRVARVAVAEGDTLTVRSEALVAWCGAAPTTFCPRLGLLDILLPRGPRGLAFSVHGPATVWFEGAALPPRRRRLYGVRA